jgi:hypothetical protein
VGLLVLAFALEVGFCPRGGVILYENNLEYVLPDPFYTEMEVEIRMKGLFVATSVRTDFRILEWHTFWPLGLVWGFNVGWRWNNLEVGFDHACYHSPMLYPVVTEPRLLFEGAYDQLYIRYSIEIGGKP